jgi:hypothetical protein
MDQEPNYEAIGRYVSLKEQVLKAASERNRLLDQLALLVKGATALQTGQSVAKLFNADAARTLLDQAETAQNHLLALLTQINAVAADANKPPFTMT